MASRDRRLLGEMLVEAGIVRRQDLESALAEQRKGGGSLCFQLMRLGRVTPGPLFHFLQEHFETLSPDLGEILQHGPLPNLLTARLAHFYEIVPLRQEGNTLTLAMACVDNPNLVPAVEELTGLRVDPLICPPAMIRRALEQFYPMENEPGVVRSAEGENVLVLSDRRESVHAGNLDMLPADAAGTHGLRALVAEAIKRRCREILLEPLAGEIRVVYRKGESEEFLRVVSFPLGASVMLAIEDLSRMVSRGRTVPREGRFRLRHEERTLSVLVTGLPGLQGQAYRISLLEERVREGSLEEILADYPQALRGFRRALESDRGLLLLASPEGHHREEVLSTLVSSVQARGERTLRTADDAGALFETAANQLVVAGIEKGDAFEAFSWLVKNGLARWIRAGHLSGILGLRMVERTCEHCRRPYDLWEELPGLAPTLRADALYFANVGCRACRGAGVLDLEPAFEFLDGLAPFVQPLETLGVPRKARREQARAGETTLFSSLMARAAAGAVDVREPLRLLFQEGRGDS